MSDDLTFAIDLAKQAGQIMKQNFTLGMKKEWKADNSPITATDVEINNLVLKAVEKKYPTYSFVGEEGSRIIESEYTWVCDPVDGTIPFSHGQPTFVFSLALTKNGESVLGVIYDPICDRLLHAEKGKGTFLNDKKISVSTEAEWSKTSLVSINSNRTLASLHSKLSTEGCRTLTVNSCVYTSMLVAAGEILAEVCSSDKPWDAAAVKIIVEEAGGKVTNLAGKDQRYDGPIDGLIASNGAIHQKLVDIIKPLLSSA